MGKHRRIRTFVQPAGFAGPFGWTKSRTCLALTTRTQRGATRAWAARSPIDRPTVPSPRTVKGATASSPSPALWPPRASRSVPSDRGVHFFGVGGHSIATPSNVCPVHCTSRPYGTVSRFPATPLPPACCVGKGMHYSVVKNRRPAMPRSAVPPPIRLASRASSVGARSRPQRTLPSNIAIRCDGTVDSAHKTVGWGAEAQCLQGSATQTWRDTAPRDRPSTLSPQQSSNPADHPGVNGADTDNSERPRHRSPAGECVPGSGPIALSAQNPDGSNLFASQPPRSQPFHGLRRHEHSAEPQLQMNISSSASIYQPTL